MIYSLSSSDPEHYETINVNINIPWKCEQVKYYVSNVNTMSNFLLTTDEDFLLILMEDIEYPFTFPSRTDYESSLIKDLKELFNCYEKTKTAVIEKNEHGNCYEKTKTAVIEKNEHGSLKFTLDKDFQIIDASHRVKLLLGLYHTTLPVSSTDKVYVCSSPPITNYANKLYLVSLQGQAIHASKEGMEYTPSVACSIDTFIKPGLPLIKDFDMNPIKTVIQAADLSRSSMTLVDFQFEPVVLLSPLFVTLKIKPVKKYMVGVEK